MNKHKPTARNASLRSRFISGTSWALTAKIISGASTFGVNVLLARLLAPEDLGSFFLVLSIVNTFSIIGQWGLGRGLVKLIAAALSDGHPGKARSAMTSSFIIVTFVCLTLALLIISPVGYWFLEKLSGSGQVTLFAGLIGIWIVIKGLQGIVGESFRGLHDIRFASIFGGMVTAILAMIFYLFVWVSDTQIELAQVINLMLFAAGISLVTGSAILLRKACGLGENSELQLRQVIRFGAPLMLTNIALFATLELHMWILAYFKPETEVALYGASLRLVMLLAMPLTIVNAVIPPMIAGMYRQKQYDRVQNLLQSTATLIGLPAFLMFVVIALYGEELLGLVFGEPYTVAYVPFLILATGQLINVISGSPGVLLTMSGHERAVMTTAFGASTIGITASLIGVQAYGATGAALGYALGISSNNIAMWAYSWHKLSIKTHGNVRMLVDLVNQRMSKRD